MCADALTLTITLRVPSDGIDKHSLAFQSADVLFWVNKLVNTIICKIIGNSRFVFVKYYLIGM